MPQTPKLPRRYSIGAATFEVEKLEGGLYIVATPIGNLGDITIRALATLAAADTIYCEDTRITSRLLHRYGITAELAPYHDHNAAKLRPEIVNRLHGGAPLALVSDAGTPLISDPGYKLVRAVIAEGLHVEVIPGASAAVTALALSGLPSDRFTFCGFLPAKRGERDRFLSGVKTHEATLVFYESANRIVASLEAIRDTLGDRDVAVGRELTKLHEEALRGKASEVAETLRGRASIKGEITLVVGPAPDEDTAASAGEIDAALLNAAREESTGKAAARVAKELGLPKRELYARLVALKNDGR
jgi:16S rRNA (cytidine1402-2'-O)-methyltransferase